MGMKTEQTACDIVPPKGLAELHDEIVQQLDTAHFSTQAINPTFTHDRTRITPIATR